MTDKAFNAARLIAFALIVSIVTQIYYFVMLGEVDLIEGWTQRQWVWGIETVAFVVMSVAGLNAMIDDVEHRTAWGALAISGIFNTLQAGMGLAMFVPAYEAIETQPAIFMPILAGAFFFYFLAKGLIAMALIGFGLSLFRRDSGLAKGIGGLSVLGGVVATGLAILTMIGGREYTIIAGASGTVAALLAAIAILMLARKAQ